MKSGERGIESSERVWFSVVELSIALGVDLFLLSCSLSLSLAFPGVVLLIGLCAEQSVPNWFMTT